MKGPWLMFDDPTSPISLAAAEAAAGPVDGWHNHCHEVSLALVRSGHLPAGSRVARGTANRVRGQHSWVVLGEPDGARPDVYSNHSRILDPTLSGHHLLSPRLWVGSLRHDIHRPFGCGPHIMQYGRPKPGDGPPVELLPEVAAGLSDEARWWLELFGPLDRRGWASLASLTVEGWPAGEVLAAMDDTPALEGLVPIDRLGMLTDRNPDGLYW